MIPRREFRPDLVGCVLEDRLTPVIPNLGVVVQTTSGYMLLIPFPGAMGSPVSLGAVSGPSMAASVSGTSYNLPFFMMGSGGISTAIPGNITGFPGLGIGVSASAAGLSLEIDVGSGANDANAFMIPVVTRNTIAYNPPSPTPLIGGQPDTTAPLLPPLPTPLPPAPPPIPTSDSQGGPAMPPPGSSLTGPFVRFPSTPPRNALMTLPAGPASGGF